MSLAWVLILGILSYYFYGKQKTWFNPNQNPSSAQRKNAIEVVLLANRENHYVLTGKINGYPVTFFVDTGASTVTVPAKLAKSLALKKGYSSIAQTANGQIMVYQTQLQTLNIGAIQLKNIHAVINPAMQGDEVLLGMSALKKVQFSQKQGKLFIKSVT